MRAWIGIPLLAACATPTFDAQTPEWTLVVTGWSSIQLATTPTGDLIILAFPGVTLGSENIDVTSFRRLATSCEMPALYPASPAVTV